MLPFLRSHARLVTLLCLTVFVWSTSPSIAAPRKRKAGNALTAGSLVTDMQKAVAFIALSAKDQVSIKSKEARPFWSALKTASEALDDMETGLKGDNDDVIAGLHDLSQSVTQLTASWAVLRGSHPKSQIGRGVIALSEAFDAYTYEFGPTVARFKKGGAVTKDERAIVEDCLDELAALGDSIEALVPKTKANSFQRRLVVDLLNLIDELLEVKVDNKVKSYCKFMYQWQRLAAAAGAYSEIIEAWYPALHKQWAPITASYKEMTLDFAEITMVYYDGWSYQTLTVADYGDYYERTAVLTTVTEEVESTYESYTEEYAEEEAVEESSEELAEINEEMEVSEDEEETIFEEVEDSEDDLDGDGVDDEEDADDDNDGVADEEDGDDDGDGISDEEDADEDESYEEDEDEDADDDGIDDDDDGDDV